MPRAIASATVSFGLVTIPVSLYAATESAAEIRFHWLHRKCGTRVKQQYYCPKDDEVVSRKDLVKGYEFAKGRYVAFTPEELEALEQQSTQAIDIREFVPIGAIDPVYFERAYHVGPGKGGKKALAMLGRAMAESERAALGQYAARGKQYLVCLRVFGDSLVLQQLHYPNEIRPAVEAIDGKPNASELKLAKQLIDQISTEKFEPEKYEDEVRERVLAQIHRKVKGEEIEVPPAETRKGEVIDLMKALKASLASHGESAERKPTKRAGQRAGGGRRRRAAKRSSAA